MTDEPAAPRSRRTLTAVLFAVYAALLIGLILFKFPFNYQGASSGRELNLIPFAGSLTHDGAFRWSEVVENVLVFVPFGIYLGMLAPRWSVGRRILPIVATTVAFEAIQYLFAIGRSDITDVIGNTVGGIIGLGLYAVVSNLLKSRTDRVLNAIGIVVTALALLVFALLGVHSLSR